MVDTARESRCVARVSLPCGVRAILTLGDGNHPTATCWHSHSDLCGADRGRSRHRRHRRRARNGGLGGGDGSRLFAVPADQCDGKRQQSVQCDQLRRARLPDARAEPANGAGTGCGIFQRNDGPARCGAAPGGSRAVRARAGAEMRPAAPCVREARREVGTRAGICGVPRGGGRMAGGFQPVPRADGGEWPRGLDELAGCAEHGGEGARVARGRASQGQARKMDARLRLSRVCAVALLQPVARGAGARDFARREADGRRAVRHLVVQRGCVFPAGAVRPRMVRRRSAGDVFQGRCLRAALGAELGNPALPLGRDGGGRLRVVASAGGEAHRGVRHFPDRPRARLLPHLQLPVAAEAQRGIPQSLRGGGARAHGRKAAAFPETCRRHARALRCKSAPRATGICA